MNHIERFKAICAGEKPDYVPIFGFGGGSEGMRKKSEKLTAAAPKGSSENDYTPIWNMHAGNYNCLTQRTALDSLAHKHGCARIHTQ